MAALTNDHKISGWGIEEKMFRSPVWDLLSLKCLPDLYLMLSRKLNIQLWILREVSSAWHVLSPEIKMF